jgi:two-component system, OmpR family, alkaline phosphatase synthesis response regulator PhoP
VTRPRRRALVVEDEPSLQLTLRDRLESEGYDVTVAGDGEEALALCSRLPFDVLLLDIALPGRDGLEVCRDLRARGTTVPILMLTARSQLVDRVVGLKLGADDYLTKPFEMAELLARIEALLRRAGQPRAAVAGTFGFGEVEVDFRGAEVKRRGERIELSNLELRLLRYLVDHRGEVISRDRLLDEVWGYRSDVYSRTVDVHVASLRQKLEENPQRPQFLLTVRGMGYKFAG